MFKIAQAVDLRSRAEARDVIRRIYSERPDYWPHGIDMNGFDGGLYLVREKGTRKAAGFVGWQERWEMAGNNQVKTGYYSIGILPEFRRNGFAKQAVSRIINLKAAGVDRVQAYIMPHNKPSLELAKALDVPVVKKASQRDPGYGPGFLAAGATGIAAKGLHDLNTLSTRMREWDRSVRGLAPNRQHLMDLDAASNAVDKYIFGGQRVAQSKVLGIPAGRWLYGGLKASDRLAQMPHVPGFLAPKWYGTFTRQNPGTLEHYKMFSDPRLSPADIRGHMMEKALDYAFGPGTARDPKLFTSEMQQLIGQNRPIAETVRLFEQRFPNSPAAQHLRQAIVGVPGTNDISKIGEGLRLIGNRAAGRAQTVASTPEVYRRVVGRYLNPILRARGPALALGGGVAAGLLMRPWLSKHASVKRADTSNSFDTGMGGGLAAVSPFAGYYGYKRYKNPNRRIGLTWGETSPTYGMIDVGAGHKSPAMAIKQMLGQEIQNNPAYKGYSLHELPRNSAGLINYNTGSYNSIVDTGLGLYGAGPEMDGILRTHKERVPNLVKAQTHFPVLTDMLASDRGGTGATRPYGPKSVFLGYGPGFESARPHLPGRKVSVSSGITPAIDQDALDILRQPLNRDQTMQELVEFYNKQGQPELAKQLQGIGNNRMVVVSGSGRGDYVASRAADLSAKLKAQGLNDVKVVAQMAAAYDDPHLLRLVQNDPNIVALPKMPRKHFINLQRLAELHAGSSGTSSLAESLISDTPQVLPKDWGFRSKWFKDPNFDPSRSSWRAGNAPTVGDYMEYQRSMGGGAVRSSRLTPGTPAWRQHELLQGLGLPEDYRQMAVSSWNRGNLQYAHGLPGVVADNTGDEIVRLLKSPEALAKLRLAAKERSASELAKILAGRQKMTDTILSQAARNVKLQRMGGVGGMLGGLGLLGGGVYLMRRRPKREELPERLNRFFRNFGR